LAARRENAPLVPNAESGPISDAGQDFFLKSVEKSVALGMYRIEGPCDGTSLMRRAERRQADEPPATIEEISEAIAALAKGELIRLRKFAYRRYWTLGRRGAGLSPEDLLQNALVAVLEGRRKWKRSRVDFVKFLIGVIQSLSSHIVEGKPLDAFDDVVAYEAPDEDTDALDRRPSPTAPTPAEQLENAELEREASALDGEIREHFKDDDHALIVYEGLCDNMKPAEIRECGVTEKEFDAAQKRLKRGVKRIAEGGER
jgi:DNA-directed RNA polymerase specialized sigma24 family protein